MTRQKRYEELTFADNYMFCKILSTNKDLCKALIEVLLDIKVKDVSYPTYEKVLEGIGDSRGIRLDVYVDDDAGTIYDLEMQTTLSSDLSKRSRYYQSMIDLDILEKGSNYNDLNRTFIIFICLDDPFDRGLSRYRFRNVCAEDNTLILGDESEKVFINASGNRENLSEELVSFLDMLVGITPAKDSLAGNIANAVVKAKEYYRWKEEYKSMINWLEEERDRMVKEALEEAIAEKLEEAVSERLEEAVSERLEEAVSEKIEESVAQTVRRLLIKNYPDGEIIDITECSPELLEKVKNELKK